DLRLAHVALRGEVPRIARAAEYLHGIRCDLHGVVGGDELRDGCLTSEGDASVFQAGRGEVGGTTRLDRGGHVGEHEAKPVVLDYRFAEGLAGLRVLDRDIEGGLSEPGGDGGNAEPAAVEGG